MSAQWTDQRQAQFERDVKAAEAQRELAPSRTPEQREADASEAESQQPRHWHKAIWKAFEKLGATTIKQAARIDAQNAWNGNQTREISRLAERVAKLEAALSDQGSINRDIYRQMDRWRAGLHMGRVKGDDALDQRIRARAIELERRIDKLDAFMKRAIKADPRLGKLTIEQQCDAVTWRPPADSEVISGESVYAPLEEEDDGE